jgi:hypothetical protein
MRNRDRKRIAIVSAVTIAVALAWSAARNLEANVQTVQAPKFEVDPMWPKPLPHHWVLGNVIGVGVDAQDHVFIVHRVDTVLPTENGAAGASPESECCVAAPPVIEFDPEGYVVNAWGGPPADGKYVWPSSNHGISIDDKNNVWIGGNGTGNAQNAGPDSHILKFTHDGKFLMQIGDPLQAVDSRSTSHFGRVAKISFDIPANEAYIADGYGNKRVAVLDMTTGAIKRFWGAYGNVPSDSNYGPYNPDVPLIPQFRNPVHCAEPTPDGLVYVCDRVNDRIQVFTKAGKFVKEQQVYPRTRGDGSVWDIAFSKDPQQKWIFMADGVNEHVVIIDRQTLTPVYTFGDGGNSAGEFHGVHSIAIDSKGNLFTTETYEGRRIQKFIYKGMGAVTKMDEGVAWPKS